MGVRVLPQGLILACLMVVTVPSMGCSGSVLPVAGQAPGVLATELMSVPSSPERTCLLLQAASGPGDEKH